MTECAGLLWSTKDTNKNGVIIYRIETRASREGMTEQNVLCWMDDVEDDFNKAWRRLTGVTFPLALLARPTQKAKELITPISKQNKQN